MRTNPHYVIGPTVILALLMGSLNFLSDVMSERFDPVRRRRAVARRSFRAPSQQGRPPSAVALFTYCCMSPEGTV